MIRKLIKEYTQISQAIDQRGAKSDIKQKKTKNNNARDSSGKDHTEIGRI